MSTRGRSPLGVIPVLLATQGPDESAYSASNRRADCINAGHERIKFLQRQKIGRRIDRAVVRTELGKRESRKPETIARQADGGGRAPSGSEVDERIADEQRL